MTEEENAGHLLAAIESEQAKLRGLLAGRGDGELGTRPPSGKWSVNENVRHLLFAEELHLGRFVPGGLAKSPLGIPPDGMRNNARLRSVGFVEAAATADVLAAWGASHAEIRPYLGEDDAKVRKELERNLRHLRAHVRVIGRLLR